MRFKVRDAGGAAAGERPESAGRPPNIVFILADDLGWRDLGCYGSTFHETPNIDALARRGVRFTNAYAACPVCSPTRASIMTGRYPARLDTTDYFGAAQPQSWRRSTPLLPAPYVDRLPLDETTIAEALGAAGYATFFAGKWHLGPEGFWPEDQGFDVNKGGIRRGGPYGGGKYFSPYGNPRLEDGPDGEHLPIRLGRETAAFIAANRDRPFLAFLSFYSVHTPLMARDELRAKYEQKRDALGEPGERWGVEGERKVRLVQDHAVYAGMVDAMDEAVGIVIDELDRLGLADDTIVVFMSDNGGLSTSEGHPTSNLPLRAGKGWMYEGGIREPMIMVVPGVTGAGEQCDHPVSSVDFFPTLLAAAGVAGGGVAGAAESEGHAEGRRGTELDGVNLMPLLRGNAMPARPLFWHYPHYGNQGGSPSGAVRIGDWKLIEWYEDGRLELFNLAMDIGEQDDLSDRETDRVRAMHRLFVEWRARVDAKMPQARTD
ncbi:MAG: sulfatase [Planctomycetota bacterium]